jgi:hypothetical protein
MKSPKLDASKSATMVNLDSGHYPNQYDIPHENLKMGCETVFKLMKQSKPRVVIALGNVTWSFLPAFILQNTMAKQVPLNILTRDPIIFKIPDCEFNTFLIKSPQHPSWPRFNTEVAKTLRDAVDWFLANDK